MDARTLLLNRRSASRLTTPARRAEALKIFSMPGMRAPDHGALQPRHFIVMIRDDGIRKFSQLLKSGKTAGLGPEWKKARNAPLRAPLIITVIAKVKPEHKVPEWEQVAAAGCSVHAMQMAAVAPEPAGSGAPVRGQRTGGGAGRSGMEEHDKLSAFCISALPALKAPAKVAAPDLTPFVTYF